jgi:tetratricopeptide (TPR) repeat protein
MNNLAFGYRTAGKLDQALPLAQQAMIGVEKRKFDMENAAKILSTLIDIHEQLKQYDQADEWRRKWVAAMREKAGAESVVYAAELARFGMNRLERKQWVEAETVLRECLAIRLAKDPDAWTTFNSRSQLGGALLGQGQYAEAEPLLVQGYTGMKEREAKIPASARVRLTEAVERLVQLYESLGKPAEAAKWRDALQALAKP